MKRIGFFIFALCVCVVQMARSDTVNVNWLNEDGTTYSSSTCTVGGDIVVPQTPPTKYGYTFVGWKTPYTPIEYLESTGTQYINTGFKPNQNTRVSMEYMIPSCNNSGGFIYGARAGNPSSDQFGMLYAGDGFVRFDHGTQTNCGNLSSAFYNSKLNLEMVTPNNLTIANATTGTQLVNCTNNSNNSQSNFSLVLFGLNNAGTSSSTICTLKIYSFKLYDNGTLVRDFIPVIRNSDGAAGMYDIVNSTFYANAGTGTFNTGPEL